MGATFAAGHIDASWLAVDWDPLYYGWPKDASPEVNASYDSPAELTNCWKVYVDAIHCASVGKPTHYA